MLSRIKNVQSFEVKAYDVQVQKDFFNAVKVGDLDKIKILLNNKSKPVNLDYQDPVFGNTAFIQAALQGHLSILQYFLERSDINYNLKNHFGCSALDVAALAGHDEVVKILLNSPKLKININAKSTKMQPTPLYLAAKQGNYSTVRLLIESKADPNVIVGNLYTLDAAVHGGHHNLSKLLDGYKQRMQSCLIQRMNVLDSQCDNDGLCFGFSGAALLSALAGRKTLDTFYDTFFLVTRLKAAELYDIKVAHEALYKKAELQALKELQIASVDTLKEEQQSLFKNEILKQLKLIRQQLPLAEKTRESQYINILALFDAIKLVHHGEKYLHLLDKPHLVKQQLNNLNRFFPLLRSMELEKKGGEFKLTGFSGVYHANLPQFFKSLRKKLIANKVNEPVGLFLTSSVHAISIVYCPHEDCWKLFDINQMPFSRKEHLIIFPGKHCFTLADKIRTGFDSINNRVIFHTDVFAAKKEISKIKPAIHAWHKKIKKCLRVTADNALLKDKHNASWLNIATHYGETTRVNQLLGMRADINEEANTFPPYTILGKAVLMHHIEIVKILLKRKELNINKRINNDFTALYLAVNKGYIDVVQLLLETKRDSEVINPNLTDKESLTPLHSAALSGFVEIVDLLLKNPQIEINISTKEGCTPLYGAAQNGHIEIVKKLLKAGADTSLTTNAEYSSQGPIDAAIKHRHFKVVELLEKDARLKTLMKQLDEQNLHSKRYLAIKQLYNSVLDSDQDEKILISNFIKLDDFVQKSSLNPIDKSLAETAYDDYIKGKNVQEIQANYQENIRQKRSAEKITSFGMFQDKEVRLPSWSKGDKSDCFQFLH